MCMRLVTEIYKDTNSPLLHFHSSRWSFADILLLETYSMISRALVSFCIRNTVFRNQETDCLLKSRI